MSLINALNIGKSALAAHQAALQVSSNNIANAGDPNYTRQVARLVPGQGQALKPGVMVGSGVSLVSIERQIDEALEGRIRSSVSDSASAQVRQQWLSQVETVFNELGDDDLSTRMSAFFNAWSSLANKPQDVGLRQVVLQNGEALAGSLRDLRGQLEELQSGLEGRLSQVAEEANALADQVAELNGQIVRAEGGKGPSANALRDQRDSVLKQLSELMDIKVQDTGDGMVNVLVGSDPLVMGTTSRGVALQQSVGDGTLKLHVAAQDDNAVLRLNSGQLGALMGLKEEISAVIEQVDDLAGNLIFEVNKLHASGQGLEGFSQVTGGLAVKDATAALSSPEAGLAFAPVNGSFVVHVKQKATGVVTSTLVKVDLDGLGGDDTSLADLASSLGSVSGVSASVVGGKLRIGAAGSGTEISFSQDSSGVLAALGVNSYFTGQDARDIAINADLKSRPSLLAAARNGEAGDNQTARAIAALAGQALSGLGGSSLNQKYDLLVNNVAAAVAGAQTNAEATETVKETLLNQREALSGVSLDEEAINLMREQRAFQGAARVITAVDELMRTLLQMV